MAGSPDPVAYRDVRPADCPALSELCLQSKAVWGYDAAFLEACRAELTLHPGDLTAMPTHMAEAAGGPLGVAQISVEGLEAELEKLFIHPGAMRRGIGRRLLAWAIGAARAAGAQRLTIVADPGAEAFYLSCGAERVGQSPSESIPGRWLPLLHLPLT
ncbi:GNAT family N-acetyltransferase [Pseudooceanicola sp.]|uniref:GNAT family N-acetyltransferase n=1 Tax=Pseudooceanicola sp. TaxID=1914328 RepID=UPI0035C767E0